MQGLQDPGWEMGQTVVYQICQSREPKQKLGKREPCFALVLLVPLVTLLFEMTPVAHIDGSVRGYMFREVVVLILGEPVLGLAWDFRIGGAVIDVFQHGANDRDLADVLNVVMPGENHIPLLDILLQSRRVVYLETYMAKQQGRRRLIPAPTGRRQV